MTMPYNDGAQPTASELAGPPAAPAPTTTATTAAATDPAAAAPNPPAPAPAPASAPNPASWLSQPTPVPSAVTAPPAQELPSGPPEGLNLDTLERQGGSTQPFRFTLEGYGYMLSDPNELDWQTLLNVASSPLRLIQALLPADDQERFYSTRLPAWKLEKLLEGYMKHYGLPPLENASGSPA